MTLSETIVKIAKSYVGEKEIKGNMGFKNPEFLAKMKSTGWELTQPWCSYFGELVWKEAFTESGLPIATIDKLFSASALSTYYNFASSNLFKVGITPKRGALVIWKHGVDPKRHEGHEGIITEYNFNGIFFNSVEGNTSGDNPNEREGEIVAEKAHSLRTPPSFKGLNLIGFVYPE